MTLLCDLARKYETDKGGNHLRYAGGDSDTCHNYTPFYFYLFAERRLSVRHVFEIGINSGGSLRMWKEFFPNAEIVGVDSNGDCMRHREQRISCYPADQNNAAQLMWVMSQIQDRPRFDLMIDDGSHELDHQIVSMKALLPFLHDDGCYVIEDVGYLTGFKQYKLADAVPAGYFWERHLIEGGLGKSANGEHLFTVRRAER